MARVEIGKGDIIQALGLDAGNAFLDMIDADPRFRHVKGILADGRLDVNSPLVAATMGQLVAAGVLPVESAQALLALGTAPKVDVGGFAIGDRVRCLTPFDAIFPGEHTVEGFGPASLLLSCGCSMAPNNIEKI